MASERIQNEYDSIRIANALDILAENLADYTPGSPVTPTNAMKAKLPSQSTTDRIADAAEHLAENLTDLSNAVEITYAAYQALTPEERANGTAYYITDYPTLGGVYFFQTKEAMDAAIQAGTVPNNAVCLVDEDTPYVVKAEAVAYGSTTVGAKLDELNNNFNNLAEVTSFSLTAGSGVESIEYTAFTYGKLVIVEGSWSGTVQGNNAIAYVPAPYIPSRKVNGSGSMYDSDRGYSRGIMTIQENDGKIYQRMTGRTISSGDFGFVYTI